MEMRVIDFGRVTPIRSQSLWHAIAYGVSDGAPPTLSFMTPESPYVSIGYHSNIEAVDVDACRRASLPVFRRMVGGGPVYLDEDQLFFQITLPLSMTPSVRSQAVRAMLLPAVDAFRDVGVDAELDDVNEIVVGDRKICGHAAGQIENAVIVVGNLITGFDHAAAASIAQTPNRLSADLFRKMLARYVTAVPADPKAFVIAAVDSYSSAYGLDPVVGSLNELETAKLDELDVRLHDRKFVRGDKRPVSMPWRVKVKSGVWVVGHTEGPTSAVVGVVDDVVTAAEWSDGGSYDGESERDIIGRPVPTAARDLKREGKAGELLGQLVDAMA
jgi:lipoate-protein ligase A